LGAARSPAPENLNLIRLKGVVDGKNRHVFSTHLSYQKAIKRIAMRQGQITHKIPDIDRIPSYSPARSGRQLGLILRRSISNLVDGVVYPSGR